MKIVHIVGVRPQFIKLFPLVKIIGNSFEQVIIHTGQHFDKKMSELFFNEMMIPYPDYNLNINGGPHGFQTGNMIIGIEKILLKEKPDIVIVYGDTNSTLAGSVAASKLNMKLLHIESGLRSFNKSMPEEINRIITDHASTYLFAPTKISMINLRNEGLHRKSYLSGDIMVDSLKEILLIADNKSHILDELVLKNENYYLLTLHRPCNVDNPHILKRILSELEKLDRLVVFPIHPRTNRIILKNKINCGNNIKFTEPLGYIDFVKLQSKSYKIITDSGGIQKEAYLLKKPCVTLRTETEWIETIESGWNTLINPVSNNYYKKIISFIPVKKHCNMFGNNVADKMFEKIKYLLSKN